MGNLLQIKAEVNQGDPLNTIVYIIGTLTLIRYLQETHPKVTQLWYSSNKISGGSFEKNHGNIKEIMVRGPARGYFLNPTKSILIFSEKNVHRDQTLFWCMVLKVVKGSCHLGSFIVVGATPTMWLGKEIQGWEGAVQKLAGVAYWNLQATYSGINNYLQQEWALV